MLLRGGRLDAVEVVLGATEVEAGVVEVDTVGDGVDDILSLRLPECGVAAISMFNKSANVRLRSD